MRTIGSHVGQRATASAPTSAPRLGRFLLASVGAGALLACSGAAGNNLGDLSDAGSGGGQSGGQSGASSTNAANGGHGSSSSTGSSGNSGNGASSSSSSKGSTDAGSTTISLGDGSAPVGAAALATKLGLPTVGGHQIFVFGYGQGSTGLDPYQGQWAVGSPVRITEQYLYQGWTQGNTPNLVQQIYNMASEQSGGAIPMFTLYQAGGGIIGCLASTTCMTTYWQDYVMMLGWVSGNSTPALMNVEPDMTGFAQMMSTDPTNVPVQVTIQSDCSTFPNNLVGYASCILHLRDTYAPNLYVGFDAADWPNGATQGIAFAKAMGAASADFATMETIDRDEGCYESGACSPVEVPGDTVYWTDTDFQSHLAEVQQYNSGFGLPIIWWQTPLGVATPNGTWLKNPNASYGYRDNRVQYFTQHAQDLVNVGGLAVVFGQGAGDQTDISTDILPDGGHQLKEALAQYYMAPVALQ